MVTHRFAPVLSPSGCAERFRLRDTLRHTRRIIDRHPTRYTNRASFDSGLGCNFIFRCTPERIERTPITNDDVPLDT